MKALHLTVAIATMLLAACIAEGGSKGSPRGVGLLGSSASFLTSGRPESGQSEVVEAGRRSDVRSFVDLASERSGTAKGDEVTLLDNGRKVSLNFVNVELQEFVRVVFDEILAENVVLDPSLTGQVTVRTSEPVSKGAALDLVRNVLRLHSASLIKSGGVYRIGPAGAAGVRAADSIRIVPLKHVNPEEARAALQPFSGDGAEVAAVGRNLVISGPALDVENMLQILTTLDVDQMRGMSFALVPLKDASAAAVSGELTQMFEQVEGKSFQAIPIQRMNAVLLITRAPELVQRAREWILRLDQAGQDARRVHVYPVQNRRATEVAQVLNGMLGAKDTTQSKPAGTAVSPALAASTQGPSGSNASGSVENVFNPSQIGPANSFSGSLEDMDKYQVQIRADASTNSLVIVAKPEDYRVIEAAIRRLDILPTQVLIEATIVEVTLNDELRHGVRWFFQHGNHGLSLSKADGVLGQVIPGLSQVSNGFNYVFSVGLGRIVLNALESVTNLEVISSPALTVLDNQTATLKVGDQVPVATRSARSVVNPEAPIVNDIELKDTGIILSVTPRVNASGLVMLDISQEASDVVATRTSNIDSPTIRQRKVNSSIAAQSGSEIVLGGLISARREEINEGVPVLKSIPLLGKAFTSSAGGNEGRTELLIIIRPTVIASRIDVHNVTQEIKARMQGVSGVLYGKPNL